MANDAAPDLGPDVGPDVVSPITTTSTPATLPSGSYPVFLALPLLVTSASATNMRLGDTSPARCVLLADAQGKPLDLTGCSIQYVLYLNGAQVLNKAATVLAALAGMVGYLWQTGDVTAAGDYHESWQVTDAYGNVTTLPTNGPSYITFSDLT